MQQKITQQCKAIILKTNFFFLREPILSTVLLLGENTVCGGCLPESLIGFIIKPVDPKRNQS